MWEKEVKEIIVWCNQNEGFLSFILSATTIIISILAIITSFKIAKLPYKIKLKVIPVPYTSSEGVMVDLVMYNQGYTETGIEQIFIFDNKKLVLGMYMGETIFIKPGYMEKCKIEISDRIEYFEKNIMDLNNKIIIMIQDSFGNEYIFKNGFPVG